MRSAKAPLNPTHTQSCHQPEYTVQGVTEKLFEALRQKTAAPLKGIPQSAILVGISHSPFLKSRFQEICDLLQWSFIELVPIATDRRNNGTAILVDCSGSMSPPPCYWPKREWFADAASLMLAYCTAMELLHRSDVQIKPFGNKNPHPGFSLQIDVDNRRVDSFAQKAAQCGILTRSSRGRNLNHIPGGREFIREVQHATSKMHLKDTYDDVTDLNPDQLLGPQGVFVITDGRITNLRKLMRCLTEVVMTSPDRFPNVFMIYLVDHVTPDQSAQIRKQWADIAKLALDRGLGVFHIVSEHDFSTTHEAHQHAIRTFKEGIENIFAHQSPPGYRAFPISRYGECVQFPNFMTIDHILSELLKPNDKHVEQSKILCGLVQFVDDRIRKMKDLTAEEYEVIESQLKSTQSDLAWLYRMVLAIHARNQTGEVHEYYIDVVRAVNEVHRLVSELGAMDLPPAIKSWFRTLLMESAFKPELLAQLNAKLVQQDPTDGALAAAAASSIWHFVPTIIHDPAAQYELLKACRPGPLPGPVMNLILEHLRCIHPDHVQPGNSFCIPENCTNGESLMAFMRTIFAAISGKPIVMTPDMAFITAVTLLKKPVGVLPHQLDPSLRQVIERFLRYAPIPYPADLVPKPIHNHPVLWSAIAHAITLGNTTHQSTENGRMFGNIMLGAHLFSKWKGFATEHFTVPTTMKVEKTREIEHISLSEEHVTKIAGPPGERGIWCYKFMLTADGEPSMEGSSVWSEWWFRPTVSIYKLGMVYSGIMRRLEAWRNHTSSSALQTIEEFAATYPSMSKHVCAYVTGTLKRYMVDEPCTFKVTGAEILRNPTIANYLGVSGEFVTAATTPGRVKFADFPELTHIITRKVVPSTVTLEDAASQEFRKTRFDENGEPCGMGDVRIPMDFMADKIFQTLTRLIESRFDSPTYDMSLSVHPDCCICGAVVCPTATDPAQRQIAYGPCKHSVCLECFQGYLTSSSKGMPITLMSCPLCRIPIDTSSPDLHRMVGDESMDEMVRYNRCIALIAELLESGLDDTEAIQEAMKTRHFHPCCEADCCNMASVPKECARDPEARMFTCPPCVERKQYALLNAAEDHEEHRCPNPECNIPFEKRDGCNHIHCPHCGWHFCYLCKESLNHLDDPYDHFGEDGSDDLCGLWD